MLQPVPALSSENPPDNLQARLQIAVGKALFDKLWVFAPSSTDASDGLGPLYNARSCAGCHQAAANRPVSGSRQSPQPLPKHYLLRLGAQGKDQPDPYLGFQVQGFAYPDLASEGQLRVQDLPEPVPGSDLLRHRRVLEWQPTHSPGPDKTTVRSLRRTPDLSGIGLLALIPEPDLRAQADPEDANGDGISGRINRVPDAIQGRLATGRFGWKAGTASLEEQVLKALHRDIGISSWLFPDADGDCGTRQPLCRNLGNGNSTAQDGFEASRVATDALVRYTRNLPPPATVAKGDRADLFQHTGCAACHRPTYRIPLPDGSLREIQAYTDGLLHDMGPGLSDGLQESGALPSEWRTPPLWGLSRRLDQGKGALLHDGRALTVLESILWHEGEAASSRQRFLTLSRDEQNSLIEFVESL